MTYNDYKKFRVVEAAEFISEFLKQCTYQDCGLTNWNKGDLSDLLCKMTDHIKSGGKED